VQQSQSGTKSFQEDEIDLRELFKILVRYKVFIAIFTIIVTFGAIIYALSKTPIYEVKSNVQVGYIGETLIVEPDTLVKILNIVFSVEDKISSNNEFISEVTTISTNKNLKNFIEIKTEAISNEEAVKKNNEVVDFIKNSYQPKIEQYITETKNSIENIKRAIKNIDDFEAKNIKEQIRILKEQSIVKINEEIKFLKGFKLKTIESKIDFHTKKLDEYTKSVNKLYSDAKNYQDVATSAIVSMQMVNYQNLILNSQNKIEDLKIEKEIISTQTIPNLEIKKENISNEQIRKLQHQIDVELVSKKIKLNEQMNNLNYNITEQNIRNNEIIGDFIVKNYPIKPKRKLIVVVAFVSGLVLSIFIAFFLNFFREEKPEELTAQML
jgi:capsular polysaccharide biosynthesis protein